MKRLGWVTIFGIPFALAASAAQPLRVEPWQPAHISSPRFESHPAFDPITGDLYFVRSSKTFEGWRILKSHCSATGWSEPQSAEFAGADGFEADPFFTAGGRALYFISSRSSDGIKRRDLDIWRVDRDARGAWGTPVRLPEPVNSPAAEWFPRPAPDGWLYFGSSRPGGLGKNDIWRARKGDGRWKVENLGPAINTAGDEYEPLPSPDGKRLIVMADGGLHESRLTASGWSSRVPLAPEINVDGSEIGALFSPSGKSLLFARDTKEPRSGEFFVARLEGTEEWPVSCPLK